MNFVPLILFCLSSIIISVDKVNSAPSKPEIGARIIGGEPARAGQFPFAAAIDIETSDSKFFCGGVILNYEWVLTAGLCVNNAVLFTIHLGSNNLNADNSDRLTLATSTYVLHPDFNPNTIANDIGLIKFREPITFNLNIQACRFPFVNSPTSNDVVAVGWGQVSDFDPELSNDLQFVSVSVLSNAECRIVYGNQIHDNMICVEGNFNEGTCTGDNGGPLVEYLTGYYWLIGIASFISGNGCESTDPSGFTRIYPYINWINSVATN